jgi:hypothetical protein
MHEVLTRLQMQGVYPDSSAAAMELLTAKMKPNDLAALKKSFVRQGFVKQWERLNKDAQDFAAKLTAKEAAAPSATWKLFQTSNPSAVLWLGLTGKGAATQNKYKNFFSVWPEAKTQVPTVIMQEMRITPELPAYGELLENYFYAVIDGKLKTDEDIKAFLEPYSPPAPPPPVTLRRGRAAKKAEGKKAAAATAVDEDSVEGDESAAKPEPKKTPEGKKLKAAAKKAAAEDARATEAAPAKATVAEKVSPKTELKAKPEEKKAVAKAGPIKAAPLKKTATKATPAKRPAAKVVTKKAVAKTDSKKPVKVAAKSPAKKSVKASAKPVVKKAAAKKTTSKKAAAKPIKKKR